MEAYTKIYPTKNGPVESTPQDPIGTLDRFPNRKVIKVNEKAKALGIREGMEAIDAFALIA